MTRYGWMLVVLLGLSACSGPAVKPATDRIDWDEWGVPHISAASAERAFFADGWAQMSAHANTLLQLYGVSRGRAAEYWGADYLESDRLVHTLGHPRQAQRMWVEQDPELKRLLAAFAAGINAWAQAHPNDLNSDNQAVLPVRPQDVNFHSLFVVNTRFIAGRELGLARRWTEKGSNAIAISPERSANGHAMLVQNPHLPWGGEFLWFEKHIMIPGHNLYGVNLVGLPGLAIGFNEALGWTHTNNTIDNADLYELTLEDGGYRFGDEILEFEQFTDVLKVRQDDGSMAEEALTVRRSVHGPVLRSEKEQALALRLVGTDRYNSLLQWWRMATATDFDAFEGALRMAQIPFWNVMYADREGNIYYLFNGLVPERSKGGWNFWQQPLDGSDPELLWTRVHPFEDLPHLLNPATGWLQNANDPPWTSTIPPKLDPGDYPAYMAPRGMEFRPQRAAQMILADDSISFDELVSIKHDTRMALADRLLDDLAAAVDAHGDELARDAMRVLEAWDRRASDGSRGAVLFLQWALGALRSGQDWFAVSWDDQQPMSTPDGIADPPAAAERLSAAAQILLDRFGRLDISWGEFNRARIGGHDYPANGAIGQLGVFRVAAAQPGDGTTQTVAGGDSWVAVVEFGKQVRARVLLSYGNSSRAGSPHHGDQLKLFSEQELRDAWLSEAQLRGHVERSEVRSGEQFLEPGAH